MSNSKTDASPRELTPGAQRGRPREFDRAQAVNTAMEVFWKKGYMQTTMGDLCKAIGISAPSFYCAFNTREGLFIETVEHYRKVYWDKILANLMAEKDIRRAIGNFLNDAVKVYLRPTCPKGCFLDISTMGLATDETRIANAIESAEKETRELFHKRFLQAIEDGQLPCQSDIPAISGAIMAFIKGIAALARKNLCQAQLMAIAAQGLNLLPPATPESLQAMPNETTLP